MKKNLVALLLVLVVVSFGLFAADPADAEFTVKTTVNGVAYIGVTTAAYSAPSASTYTLFDNLNVTAAGEQTFTAFVTSFSNHPAGYTVKMSATAMENQDETGKAPIHYTVGANSKTFNTNGGTAVEVFDSGALSAMSGQSYALSLTVDSASFAAATTGAYVGTVTFEYEAN